MKKSSKLSGKFETNNSTNDSLYLINDQYNTFDHVIDCLVAICDHGELQAEQCALITHYKGSCEIATGETNDLIPLQEDLILYGLNVEIQ